MANGDIPGHTCPDIDKALRECQDLRYYLDVENRRNAESEISSIESRLHELRKSNYELRDAAEYWKAEANSIQQELNDADKAIAIQEDMITALGMQIKELEIKLLSITGNKDDLFSQDESDTARIVIDHPDAYVRLSNGIEIQRSGEGERAVFMVCIIDGSGAIADTWDQAWEWAWNDWVTDDTET